MASRLKLISIVVPCYNEEDNIDAFYRMLFGVLDSIDKYKFEVIYVNDGSIDNTLSHLTRIAKNDKRIRVVNLSRNFGKEIATTAGIYQAVGDAIMMIDADGQHPPELIPEFIKQWVAGYQVVIGVRLSNQKEGMIKHYGSKIFYRIFNATSDTALIPGATDYRLFDQAIQKEFVHFTERYRITRGLIDWMGFSRTTIPFHAKERMGGEATYKVTQLFKLALNSFISLSMAPLYIIGYAGIFITMAAFLIGCFVFIEQITLNDPIHLRFTGTAMLSLLTLFLVGIVMSAQGLLAVYLSHIHVQTQNRPLFIVDKKNSANII